MRKACDGLIIVCMFQDPQRHNFQSKRSPVLSKRGMVACTQPLASEVGLRILQKGGTAADAAVAMAAALNVTEPCCTGWSCITVEMKEFMSCASKEW